MQRRLQQKTKHLFLHSHPEAQRSKSDNQDMGRCLGSNIAKRQTIIVFVNNVGWYVAIDDFRKQRGHRSNLLTLR
ncbi:hypothetical protein Poly41_66390 [Novipirellula artificiosorum]|uniref:Uncharacterized protein n=1 Tax=Novipirellula artificiosorum TaxID=2528016 RepID=A0A5C6D3T7_9BACT|nr:hypothetical protein Poly41_66390 [Novipirellula artificiosorum]